MTEFDDITARLADVEGRAVVGTLADHLRTVGSLVEALESGYVALAKADPDFADLADTMSRAADAARASLTMVADTIEALSQAEARGED